MKNSLFSIGAFAKQAGVSVRTLQYYDRIDLLKPTTYSEGGRRLYSDADFTRLQQILTLKLIGLTLDEIRELLAAETVDPKHLLRKQKLALTQKIKQYQTIIHVIENVENSTLPGGTTNLDQIVNIIMEVNMSNQTNWLAQFLTDEQQNTINHAIQSRSFAEQKKLGDAWQQLFHDVQAHLANESEALSIPTLLERWEQLMMSATQGDHQVQTGIETAYTHLSTFTDIDHLPEDIQTWLQQMQEASIFIVENRETPT